MNPFNINYPQLIKSLLPSQLQRLKMIAWLLALLTPVMWLYNLFTGNRQKNLYRLNHSSQVCRMQAVLNDQFDSNLRRIVIVDAPEIDGLHLFRHDEQKPVYLFRSNEASHLHIWREQEVSADGGPGFIVQVPAAVTFNLAQMRALINDYRLASKNYTIQIV